MAHMWCQSLPHSVKDLSCEQEPSKHSRNEEERNGENMKMIFRKWPNVAAPLVIRMLCTAGAYSLSFTAYHYSV